MQIIIKNLFKLFRLWRVYARMDLLLMTRDLKSIVLWYISDGLLNIASITGVLLLAERFSGIGSWSKYHVLFMLGYASLIDGLLSLFFGYNVSCISRRIGRGQLDHTLVQPQPLWLSLLTEGFSPFYASSVLLPGILLIWWSCFSLHLHPSAGWCLTLLTNMSASVVLAISFQFFWGSLAFWAPRSAEEISSSTLQLLEQLKAFPLDGLNPILVGSLLTVLPVGFLGWIPARSLLGMDNSIWSAVFTPFAAVLMTLLSILFFRKGLRRYARTGSARYSNFGHRG